MRFRTLAAELIRWLPGKSKSRLRSAGRGAGFSVGLVFR
jgi:hypothetical protein